MAFRWPKRHKNTFLSYLITRYSTRKRQLTETSSATAANQQNLQKRGKIQNSFIFQNEILSHSQIYEYLDVYGWVSGTIIGGSVLLLGILGILKEVVEIVVEVVVEVVVE